MGIMLDRYVFEDDFTAVAEAHPLEDQFEEPATTLFIYVIGDRDPVHSIVLRNPNEANDKIQDIMAMGGFWVDNGFYPYHSIALFWVK